MNKILNNQRYLVALKKLVLQKCHVHNTRARPLISVTWPLSPEQFQESFPSSPAYTGGSEIGKQPFINEQKLLPAQFWGQLFKAL